MVIRSIRGGVYVMANQPVPVEDKGAKGNSLQFKILAAIIAFGVIALVLKALGLF